MKKLIYVLGAISCLILACKKHPAAYKEVKSDGLLIQTTALNQDQSEKGDIAYRVRLIPDKAIYDKIGEVRNKALLYQMDTCFYIIDKGIKNFASVSESVPNGIHGTYEYLVTFDIDRTKYNDSLQVFYQDRYINKKNYQLIKN